jgi:hypothetical protein
VNLAFRESVGGWLTAPDAAVSREQRTQAEGTVAPDYRRAGLSLAGFISAEESKTDPPNAANGGWAAKQQTMYAARTLFAEFQAAEQIEIELRVRTLDIVQQTAPTTHHLEQPAPAREIFRMRLQMLGKLYNPAGQNSDLHLRRTRVTVLPSVLGDNFLLPLFRDRHRLT